AEWSCATVGPREGLGAIVGCVNDDGILSDAEIVKLPQELTDLPVVLHHAIGINAKSGLSLRVRLEMSPYVHPSWIEPDEEWLLLLICSLDEVQGCRDELFIDRLHALLCERTCILTSLLAPRTEAGIIARCVRCRRKTFEHATGSELRSECWIFRIIRVLGFLFGIEVIEIAEELIE